MILEDFRLRRPDRGKPGFLNNTQLVYTFKT
jgi:hypothetical protein